MWGATFVDAELQLAQTRGGMGCTARAAETYICKLCVLFVRCLWLQHKNLNWCNSFVTFQKKPWVPKMKYLTHTHRGFQIALLKTPKSIRKGNVAFFLATTLLGVVLDDTFE